MAFRSPVIRGRPLRASAVVHRCLPAYASQFASWRAGGRRRPLSANEPGEVKLSGELRWGTIHATTRRPMDRRSERAESAWCRGSGRSARIARARGSRPIAARSKQVIDLSKRYHVMSRYTSLLVLENDQMFAEFGIKRTQRPPRRPRQSDVSAPAPAARAGRPHVGPPRACEPVLPSAPRHQRGRGAGQAAASLRPARRHGSRRAPRCRAAPRSAPRRRAPAMP